MNHFNNVAGTIKCKNGGEFKTKEHFSKSSLQKYSNGLRTGSATRKNSGISCKRHTAGQNDEIQCLGPCSLWKARDAFSKSTLRNGKNWCHLCTEWQLRTEAGETLPPPGSTITDEDRRPNVALAVPEIPMVFNGNDDDTQSMVSTAATLGAAASSEDADPYRHLIGRQLLLPPHLRSADVRPRRIGDSREGYYVWSDETGDYEKEDPANALQSSAAHPSSAASPSPAPGRVPARAPVPFTAYGPQGQRVPMIREPSVVSTQPTTTTSDATIAGVPVRVGKSGWAKPPSRKQAPQVPDYLEEGFVNVGFDDYDGDSPDEL
ncbi:Stc1 domain-containing protein [Cladorrhinum sp. PSN332]|nr:Stc1 domain-containing protein [Cladorrhinum sp. PSN332]